MKRIMPFFDKHYKKLMLIPLGILLLSILIIGGFSLSTGDFIRKGVSLKGGTLIEISGSGNRIALENVLKQTFPSEDISTRPRSAAGKEFGVLVETTNQDPVDMIEVIKKNYNVESVSKETTGPSLGASFFKETIMSVIIAFIFMGVVVFLYFRKIVPSTYVISAALADILFAWAMTIVFNIRISTAGVAAFLMLVGYSVDTDILLTTRVLKRSGNLSDKIYSSFSTGSIMTLTGMAAAVAAYLLTPAESLKQIMLILFFGLIADLWNTWLLNTSLLKLYLERKKR